MAKTLSKIKLAYAAGIFDGEGCVSIHKRLDKRCGRKDLYQYRFIMCVVNTDKHLLDWLKENFGGSIDSRKTLKDTYLPQWVWRKGGLEGIKFLKKIIPYLIVKKDQVEATIKYEFTIANSKKEMTDELRTSRIKIYDEVKMFKSPTVRTTNYKNGWGVTRFIGGQL